MSGMFLVVRRWRNISRPWVIAFSTNQDGGAGQGPPQQLRVGGARGLLDRAASRFTRLVSLSNELFLGQIGSVHGATGV